MDKGNQDDKNETFNIDFIADYTVNISDVDQENDGKPAAQKKRHADVDSGMGLYDWLQCIVSAVVAGILIFVFVGKVDVIKGRSMMHTLQDGDAVVLSNLFFTPKYQDIVFIKSDAYDTPIVKRVIATAGQSVDIDFEKGVVSVDGAELKEDYISTPTTIKMSFEGPVTVPEGHVFILGDNRNDSSDSRDDRIGMIDVRDILGKVYFILIPGKGPDAKRDWSRIGPVR